MASQTRHSGRLTPKGVRRWNYGRKHTTLSNVPPVTVQTPITISFYGGAATASLNSASLMLHSDDYILTN